jgi:hypothetical protein
MAPASSVAAVNAVCVSTVSSSIRRIASASAAMMGMPRSTARRAAAEPACRTIRYKAIPGQVADSPLPMSSRSEAVPMR